MSGVWLLPTKGRPENVRRFFNAAREMGTSTPGWVIINQAEWDERRAAYEALLPLAPPDWVFKPVKASSYGAAIRSVWPEIRDFKWVGLVSDDLVPSSSIWDKQLIAATTGWNVVSSNDGWQAPNRMHGATVWSGDLMRAVGWIFPEGLKHIFHDDIWETLGRETGCWQVRMDIMVKHLHEALSGVKGPTMDPASDLWKHDQAVFEDWRDKGQREANITSIKLLMEATGVRMMTPDFTGVRLMIGVPSHDGRYESSFMVSLFQSFDMLKGQGVTCELAEEKYTADICLARAHLFAAFVRSKASHLLMVDADMGWSPEAISRLFCAKKDMVAVAGPKKRYPLQFAANYTDAAGTPIELMFDRDTGTMEIGEVGCAFMLISRRCAETMVRSYTELEYDGVGAEPEWAVFNPLVMNRRYYSEDFAFCRRWRNIGGTLHIAPDVALKHTGFHTFEGAFSQLIPQPPPAPHGLSLEQDEEEEEIMRKLQLPLVQEPLDWA